MHLHHIVGRLQQQLKTKPTPIRAAFNRAFIRGADPITAHHVPAAIWEHFLHEYDKGIGHVEHFFTETGLCGFGFMTQFGMPLEVFELKSDARQVADFDFCVSSELVGLLNMGSDKPNAKNFVTLFGGMKTPNVALRLKTIQDDKAEFDEMMQELRLAHDL